MYLRIINKIKIEIIIQKYDTGYYKKEIENKNKRNQVCI